MKILSQPDKNWTYEYECMCKSVIEVEMSDLLYWRSSDFYQFCCPVCKRSCTLSSELIPYNVKALAAFSNRSE